VGVQSTYATRLKAELRMTNNRKYFLFNRVDRTKKMGLPVPLRVEYYIATKRSPMKNFLVITSGILHCDIIMSNDNFFTYNLYANTGMRRHVDVNITTCPT